MNVTASPRLLNIGERDRLDIDPQLTLGGEIQKLLECFGQDAERRHRSGTRNRYCRAAQGHGREGNDGSGTIANLYQTGS